MDSALQGSIPTWVESAGGGVEGKWAALLIQMYFFPKHNNLLCCIYVHLHFK